MKKAVLAFFSFLMAGAAWAAPLGFSARTIIPADVQQIISVDYRTMRNSPTAMALKERVLPDNLKQFETSMKAFGVKPDQDIDQLSFVSFRAKDKGLLAVGIAQGEFPLKQINARVKTKKLKPVQRYRFANIFSAEGGMQMTFLDDTTMLFGEPTALHVALDTRDGESPSLNSNAQIADMMTGIERQPVWSVLDNSGTQNMMRSALGDASQLTDYESIKKRLLGSRYTMDFNSGVNFNLDVFTSDNFTAASLSSLVKAGVLYKQMSATGVEKVALNALSVGSDNDKLQLHFATDDKQFESLLRSDLFAAVSK